MKRYSFDRRPTRVRCLHRGFTVVELLVVIAIISMILAILLPSLSAARRASWTTACKSNLRELARAWSEYCNQNSDHFLQDVNTHINYGGKQGITQPTYGPDIAKPLNAQLNQPLVTTAGIDVFRCPLDVGNKSRKPSCYDYYGTSYMTNVFLVGQDQLPANPFDACYSLMQKVNKRMKRLTRARVSVSHADVPLIGDFGFIASWDKAESASFDWHAKPAKHNIAFLDGHVDFIQMQKGMHVTNDYCLIPFDDLADEAKACQQAP